jgi:beta-galactosidase
MWSRDAKLLAECNFDAVRVGEFAWCRMEPEEGTFDFSWLDRAIETLAQEGLQVILGTPTATPPAWLIHKHREILPVDAMGIRTEFGVRKHYCHSNPDYRKYARRIAKEMAEHYQDNPHVYGWQIDNEFGDHDTVRCYCESCQSEFRAWLRQKYASLEELNAAWGTIFWSQEYTAWEQIPLPTPRRPIGLNPSHLLDYYRFASDQVIDFAKVQTETIREIVAPAQRITTNVIATFWEINFAELAEQLDFIGWDCYTMIDAMSSIRYPDGAPPPPVTFPPRPAMVSLVHDLMRSFKKRPFWVLETAGQDRLVTYHTLAHGGEGISFFRWRGVRFGAEQSRGGYEYHGILSNRYKEGQKIGEEVHRIADVVSETTFEPSIGLLYSFDMGWAYDIAHVYPRSTWVKGTSYWRLLEDYYTHFWHHNVPVQPLLPSDDLEQFPVIVVPCLYLVNEELTDKLCAYVRQGGTLIVGPESGTKNWDNVYINELPPAGKLEELFGCALIGNGGRFRLSPTAMQMEAEAPFAAGERYDQADSDGQDGNIFGGRGGAVEELRAKSATVWARYADSDVPAITGNKYGEGQAIYLGWTPPAAFFDALIQWLEASGKAHSVFETPPNVEATVRKNNNTRLIFLVNHNFEPKTITLDKPYRELVADKIISDELILAGQSACILSPVEA